MGNKDADNQENKKGTEWILEKEMLISRLSIRKGSLAQAPPLAGWSSAFSGLWGAEIFRQRQVIQRQRQTSQENGAFPRSIIVKVSFLPRPPGTLCPIQHQPGCTKNARNLRMPSPSLGMCISLSTRKPSSSPYIVDNFVRRNVSVQFQWLH